MTGPQHYRQAEQHLGHAAEAASGDPDNEITHLLYAHVHATLALAAAQATGEMADDPDEGPTWAEVTGT